MRANLSQLCRLVGRQSGSPLTDAQLLENFVSRRDETAFEVLVWRHGTMVLSLCQRILRDTHEAEDAFQATFLLLARKAGSIGKRAAVAGWLYQVAYRVALRLRAKSARHSTCEESVDDLPAREGTDEVLWRDLRPVLDEEIDRLPEKYRLPFVLCYLQGHTNEEAAEQLGCPKGTILSRLARGREQLRSRLTRRGLALSAGGVVAALSQNAAPAVPAALASSTVQAAISFAAGKAAAGLVSASVAALTEGVLHTMFLTKVKMITAALLALAVLGTGTGLVVQQVLAERLAAEERKPVAERGTDRAADRTARPEAKAADLTGKVIAVAKDHKSITLQVPGQARGDEPKKLEIKIGDKTAVFYSDIGLDGAKPTEGHMAQVRLAEGSQDVAGEITFHGSVGFRSPDLTARVVAVAADGKGITVEVPSARPREEEPKKLDLKLTDKTVLGFYAVAKGGAKLTEGYIAQVWFEDGPKGSIVATMHLGGKEEGRPRRAVDIAGKVIAVAKDSKSITLEQPPQARGEESKKVEVKLGDKTHIVYNGVGPDGTSLAEGNLVHVYLEEGSKDSAALVGVSGVIKERGTQVAGKVLSVAKGGETITLEQPAQGRGEEPKKIDVKITPKTRIAFYGVGPDGAQPTEGYIAQVRMEDGTALQVSFSKPGGERRR